MLELCISHLKTRLDILNHAILLVNDVLQSNNFCLRLYVALFLLLFFKHLIQQLLISLNCLF